MPWLPKSLGDIMRRHQMETFSTLLAFRAGNSPVTGEFPAQRPVTRSFDVSFDLRNQQLSNQWRHWWFETPSRSLLRHCIVYTTVVLIVSCFNVTALYNDYLYLYKQLPVLVWGIWVKLPRCMSEINHKHMRAIWNLHPSTCMYIYIYIYMCVCVCVCQWAYDSNDILSKE